VLIHDYAEDGNIAGVRDELAVRGGTVCTRNAEEEEYIDNPFEYVLSLNTLVWHRMPHAC
jgi:hypothetical protein